MTSLDKIILKNVKLSLRASDFQTFDIDQIENDVVADTGGRCPDDVYKKIEFFIKKVMDENPDIATTKTFKKIVKKKKSLKKDVVNSSPPHETDVSREKKAEIAFTLAFASIKDFFVDCDKSVFEKVEGVD